MLPLDGGRAMAAMAPWMWFVGFGALLALLFVAPNPILILILLLGGMETWRRWKQPQGGRGGQRRLLQVKPAPPARWSARSTWACSCCSASGWT